jgi:predicted GH43/DUF377 family glycosyl hydrolase
LPIALAQTAFAQTALAPYAGNPVLELGPAGSWDAGVVMLPSVSWGNNRYYMLYTGVSDMATQPPAIGLATSTDGLTFTKHDSNPLLEGDGSGFDAYGVGEPVILRQYSGWFLLYNARSEPGSWPGPSIGRAVAQHPNGPWTRSELPVLEVGSAGEWDSGFVTPNSLFQTSMGYIMYYSGGSSDPMQPSMIGYAISPDGLVWLKYDDPATTEAPFAESDPILPLGETGAWDSGSAWECAVVLTLGDWEMYYTGAPSASAAMCIGYATSEHGWSWDKFAGNPILEPIEPWANLGIIAGSAIDIDSVRHLYYTGFASQTGAQIGVARATATGVEGEQGPSLTPARSLLGQNYPNPFNPRTRIPISIDAPVTARLMVYDASGRLVRMLVDGELATGEREIVFDADGLAGGIYYYRLDTGSHTETRPMVVLK